VITKLMHKIEAWWQKRLRKERTEIINTQPNLTSLDRCVVLLDILHTLRESDVDGQGLMFYQTRLTHLSFGNYVYMIRHLTKQTRTNGGLVRNEANVLDSFISDTDQVFYSFFTEGDSSVETNLQTFVSANLEFCKALLEHQDGDAIESIHTMRLTQRYIVVLEEALVSLMKCYNEED